MKHRMTVQNASEGWVYELVLENELENELEQWRGRWRTLDGNGEEVKRSKGELFGSDAYTLFRRVARILEDFDDAVSCQDWDFEPPLPPWMVD